MPTLEEAHALMDEAYDEHKPPRIVTLFSGGHDSLTAATVAFSWGEARGVPVEAAHIRTGTGVPETTEFVQQVCADHGWPLRIFDPPVPYEELVLEYGFPGPGQHGLMYQRLKERCLRILIRTLKDEVVAAGEREQRERNRFRIGLVTGVRSQESVRRMRHVERIQTDGGKLWIAPVWNWSKIECARFLRERGMPRNPVVDKIHMSGECLCGAFARPGEISELEMWFPEVAARIHALEEKAREKGLRGCVWGQRPPKVARDQMSLEFPDAPPPGIMCVGCEERLEHEHEHEAQAA